MIILGIETSGRTGSVALCSEDGVLAAHTFEDGARHARDVVPAIDGIVAAAQLSRRDIAAVAVSEGPGSFTGLRVGITCAKTLAYALGWKAVGVPSLEIKAQNVAGETTAECRHVCPVLDARRGRVYGTVFQWNGDRWLDKTGVLVLPPQELALSIPEGALVFGSGVTAYAEAFGNGHFRLGDEGLEVGRAEAAARIGLARILAGRDVEPMKLMPKYYRLTEPEEKAIAAAQTAQTRGESTGRS